MFCPEWKLKNPNTEKLIGQFFPNKNHLKSTVRDLTQFRYYSIFNNQYLNQILDNHTFLNYIVMKSLHDNFFRIYNHFNAPPPKKKN